MNEKPPVKTYCGGVPNYCTPEVTPEVTGEVGACVTCGAPKSEWLVDALNMTQERVDETAKGEHMIDCTDKQLMEEVRRRGFVIRDAQVGAKWVGLTDEEYEELLAGDWGGSLIKRVEAKLKEKNT